MEWQPQIYQETESQKKKKKLKVYVLIPKIHFIRKSTHFAMMKNTDKPLAIIQSHLFSKGNKLFTGIVTMLMQGGP